MSNLKERGRYFSRVVWLTPCLATLKKWNLNGTYRHADNFLFITLIAYNLKWARTISHVDNMLTAIPFSEGCGL